MALWASSFKLLPFVGDGIYPSTHSQAVPSCLCALKSSAQLSQREMVKAGRIKLGSRGLEISAQGLGCMGMTPAYDAPNPEPNTIALTRRAIQNGVTFLDTAGVFGLHTNEILLSKGGLGIRLNWAPNLDSGVSAAYERAACEASLKRLKIDCIDLYYVFRIDTSVSIEVTVHLSSALDVLFSGLIAHCVFAKIGI